LGDIHDSVDDERRGLPSAYHSGLEHPFQFKIFDVRWSDLRQHTVSAAGVIPRVGEPIVRLFHRIQEALIRDLRMQPESNHCSGEQRDRDPQPSSSHEFAP